MDANIGIDLGKLNVNIPISIGLNWDNLVSVDASLNGGWADNSYGLDLSAGLHPGSNVKLGVHEKHAVDEKTTNKNGKRGIYAYGICICCGNSSCGTGVNVIWKYPSSAGRQLLIY